RIADQINHSGHGSSPGTYGTFLLGELFRFSCLLPDRSFQLRDCNLEFPRNSVRVPLLVFVAQGAIVPERPFLSSREPLPDALSMQPVICQNRADVVQFVRS